MHPILFVFSGIPIYASPVFLVLGLIIGFIVGRFEILRRNISLKVYYLYWALAVPVALFLAAINSALFQDRFIEVLSNPDELLSTGLVTFGAVIGTLGLGFIIAKANKMPTGQILDVISLILPLIFGVYRIGCILNGCCHGLETAGPYGVYLPNVSGQWEFRYPTQFMLLIFDFTLFYSLWSWRLKNPVEGNITLVFLLSFSLFRLLLDSLREAPMVNAHLNILQLGSLTILLITLFSLAIIRLKGSSHKD